MLNWIFLLLIAGAVVTGAFTDRMKELADGSLSSAKASAEFALALTGQMALWLGFMRVLHEAGLMRAVARGLRPVMRVLFPEIPPEHPAISAMVMNLAANMAGVANAATPFGLKAMQELNTLNRTPGVATNSMALFLAINSAGVAVLPLGAVAVRATLGSHDAGGIILPSFLATAIASGAAIVAAKVLEGRDIFSAGRAVPAEPLALVTAKSPQPVTGLEVAEEAAVVAPPISPGRALAIGGVAGLLLVALVLHLAGWRIDHVAWSWGPRPILARIASATRMTAVREIASNWLLPLLMVGIVLFGFGHRVRVYEAFVEGAKEGFQIAVMIIPFLVAILVAIAMLRASGAFDALVGALAPLTARVGIPAEVLPMAFMKPLSGSGALGVMTETMKTYGPDSRIGYMVSVMNAGSETTFYVLAVYFGSVQVRAVRHTLAACLVGDVVGLTGAVYLSRLFFG